MIKFTCPVTGNKILKRVADVETVMPATNKNVDAMIKSTYEDRVDQLTALRNTHSVVVVETLTEDTVVDEAGEEMTVGSSPSLEVLFVAEKFEDICHLLEYKRS